MRIEILHRLIILAAGGIFLALMTGVADANAQNVVVLVNDEPITSGDVAQRLRWNARTNGFGDHMKAILTGDSIKERFRQMMVAANPHSQAEAEQAAERIKKQLLEDAKNRVLSDGGGTSRKAAIDSLVEDKLKLQAAKKLDIKITDSEVEQAQPKAKSPIFQSSTNSSRTTASTGKRFRKLSARNLLGVTSSASAMARSLRLFSRLCRARTRNPRKARFNSTFAS